MRRPLDLQPISEHLRVVGPPGTGKTRFLTREVEHDAREYGSDNVVAVSFTKAAAAELASRVETVDPDNIGTLHALAYRAIGRPDVAEDGPHLKEFSEAYPDYPMAAGFGDTEDLEFGTMGTTDGDKLLARYGQARNLEIPRAGWFDDVKGFAHAWEEYKADSETVDFTDMIELAVQETTAAPGYPACIIADEAQDLSRLQFRLLCHWAGATEKVVMACDPDQSIYGFAGADPDVFLEVKPKKQKVLDQSYRVPRAVHAYAHQLIRRIQRREDFAYLPKPEDGAVYSGRSADTFRNPGRLIKRWEDHLAAGDSVLVLAPCAYMLRPTVELLRQNAIPFANPLRKKRGDWNPLGKRGEGSTVQALLDWLSPHRFGDRLWSTHEVKRWATVVARVFRRGSGETIRNMPEEWTDARVYECVLACVKDDADFSAGAFGSIGGAVDWFQQHLKAARKAPAEFACNVARRRGIDAVAEPPRLWVGTCHSYKGGEADHVYVWPDLSQQGFNELQHDPDPTIRLFYVACTRAKKTLTLGHSASAQAFNW